MLPLILGAGALIFLAKAFSSDSSDGDDEKLIFISFAIEDKKYRDFLVAQAKNEKSPFTFVDMSVKKPWKQSEWKRRCREKIRKCDGVIVLLSNNTYHSGGTRWEIKCALEEDVQIIGMHIRKEEKFSIPPELEGEDIIEWSWDEIDEFVKSL